MGSERIKVETTTSGANDKRGDFSANRTVNRRAPIRFYTVLNQVVALVLLVVLLPVMLWVGVRIRAEDGGPMFFVQQRVGEVGNNFGCYKLRTMRIDAEAQLADWRRTGHPLWHEYLNNNFKLADDPRLLRSAGFARRASLDELPQLFNVLKGEMHLVGPRPLIARELPWYGHSIALYGRVKPGITGLWQVSSRSKTSFQDRVRLDLNYIREHSVWLDLKILVATARTVVRREGQ